MSIANQFARFYRRGERGVDRIMNDRMIGGRWICSRLDRIGAKRRKTAAGSPKGERRESIDRINRILRA